MVINKWMSFRRTSVMVKKALELWPKSHSPFLMYPQHWVKGSLPLGILWLLRFYSAELRTAGSGTHFFEGFVRWMGLSEHWLVRLWEHGKCASSSWTVGRDFSCQSPLGLIYSSCRSPHSHGALQLRKLLLTCLVYSLCGLWSGRLLSDWCFCTYHTATFTHQCTQVLAVSHSDRQSCGD